MFSMMGGKNAGVMREYQTALDNLSKAGTEYVRGIPVVKVFQQTVYSFKAFKEAIDRYSERASYYEGHVCRVPQAINLTFTEASFVFLIPVVLFLAPGALESGNFAGFVTNFARTCPPITASSSATCVSPMRVPTSMRSTVFPLQCRPVQPLRSSAHRAAVKRRQRVLSLGSGM